MKFNTYIMAVASCIAITLPTLSSSVFAKDITLIQLSDVHGHIQPHAEIFEDGRLDPRAGGIAKLTTLIKSVRAEQPNSLLLSVGDTTHGSAEMTFSLGELIIPWINTVGIDAFTPGNWDFGYGPRVYRQRFTATKSLELAPNNRTTVAWMIPGCNAGGGLLPYANCHLEKVTVPVVAMNLYNFDEVAALTNPAQSLGSLVHLPYVLKNVGGVKVGVLGLTSDVVPQQAQAFNTGFRFTMGYKELPQQIAAAKTEGAEIIVVLSELGFAKNIQLVKEFPEINIMFSGHTHERTTKEVVITHSDGSYSLVTEAGEDSHLGRLDLKVSATGKIISYNWKLLEADSSVPEDPATKAMVDNSISTFLDKLPNGDPNPNFQCHTFGANAFPFGKGHTLCDSLDKIVGHTNITIQRWNVLEDASNNVMVDAFLDLAKNVGASDSKGNPLTEVNTLSTTNGFRFDVVILGSEDGFSGDITIADLYNYYPIGAAIALAEYTGGRLKQQWESVLDHVFDPNPYRQRGGWFLGYTHNMHLDVRFSDDYPLTISYNKRITNATINGARIDDSKIYTTASCYPHGNPIDEVCRTAGATNVRFIVGTQENSGPTDIFGNRQLDMSNLGNFSVVAPVVTTAQLPVFDPSRAQQFRKVAPDNFIHPVDAMRRYLSPTMVGHTVTLADDGPGRVIAVDPLPVSEHGGAGIVQPTQGAGPAWLKREFVTVDTQNQQ